MLQSCIIQSCVCKISNFKRAWKEQRSSSPPSRGRLSKGSSSLISTGSGVSKALDSSPQVLQTISPSDQLTFSSFPTTHTWSFPSPAPPQPRGHADPTAPCLPLPVTVQKNFPVPSSLQVEALCGVSSVPVSRQLCVTSSLSWCPCCGATPAQGCSAQRGRGAGRAGGIHSSSQLFFPLCQDILTQVQLMIDEELWVFILQTAT